MPKQPLCVDLCQYELLKLFTGHDIVFHTAYVEDPDRVANLDPPIRVRMFQDLSSTELAELLGAALRHLLETHAATKQSSGSTTPSSHARPQDAT